MNEALFVYGTLLDTDVQRKIIHRLASPEKDAISGYQKIMIDLDEGCYPAAVPSKGSDQIHGGIIHVSAAELALLDAYEGSEYERIEVILNSGKKSWMYILKEKSD